MLAPSRSALPGYGAAVAAVALALLITTNTDFLLERSPFFLFYAAVILITHFFGRGPGITTVILSAITADYFIIPPIHALVPNLDDALRIATFLLVALPICLMISALQERERKVRESGARYRTLFEYSPDGIVIATPESYYIDANESICRMLGYTRDELIGLHATDIVVSEEIPHIGEALGILRSNTDYQREWRFKRKDGSSFTGEVIATQMPDGNLLAVIRDVSEREKAQTIVAESESRLAGIIDSAMDAIITIDKGQTIVLFNAAAETMFKCAAADAIGHSIERFIPERFRTGHSEHVRRFGETHVTTRSMKALGGIFGVRTDGEEFPIEASISQLETSGQHFFTVILRDITERSRAEARFRLAVESAPNAMVMADNDGKIILINSQTEQMFGYSRDELIGLPVETLVPERFRGRHPALRKGFAADPQVRTMGAGRDLFGLRKDGAEVPVEIGLNPIEMEGGTYVLSSIVDITARKQAEERLRAAQERLSSTLLAGSIGTWTWDIVTDLLSADEFTAGMFSLDPDAASKGLPVKAYLDGVFKEDQPGVSTALEKAITSCGSYDVEYRVRQQGEKFSWLQAKGRVDCDGAGNALNFHGAVMDITNRKLAEREIHRLNAELEQRVLDRTQQLEAANKELESFSYSVSHDLRAPLRHIDGFVQLLTKREADRLDPTSVRYLSVVSEAVGRMGTLIDALLSFSRTSRVQIKAVPVDLNVLVARAKNELAPALSGRKIKWKIADLPTVSGDTVLLGIVVTNLLSNAIKYTRLRPEAHIKIGASGETEREVTIFVKDDGAGFDMKYADKLFGVFQRLHSEDEFEGIGIGLATVQRIVQRHGGCIWAESEPDKGACFYITLRRAKGEKDEDENYPAG